MIDGKKAIDGLKWVLEDDRFGFGINWTENSEPKSDEERAGYNIQMAIDMLKEREAVKPIRDKKTGRVWLCGNCGSYVGFEDHDENDPNEFDKYCRECGRPVLWEGR